MRAIILLIIIIITFSCKKDYIITNAQPAYHILNEQNWETVTINGVEWMKYNLCTTTYNDGTPIKQITQSNKWYNSTTGAYMLYNNDINIANTYGLLYNGLIIKSGKLIPKGYRLPTVEDYKQLCLYLDNKHPKPLHQLHANEIKSITGWDAPVYATNETNFSALDAGYISSTGYSMMLKKYTAYWTSTFTNNSLHFISLQSITNSGVADNYIYYLCPPISLTDSNKNYNYGYSVRLIKIPTIES